MSQVHKLADQAANEILEIEAVLYEVTSDGVITPDEALWLRDLAHTASLTRLKAEQVAASVATAAQVLSLGALDYRVQGRLDDLGAMRVRLREKERALLLETEGPEGCRIPA